LYLSVLLNTNYNTHFLIEKASSHPLLVLIKASVREELVPKFRELGMGVFWRIEKQNVKHPLPSAFPSEGKSFELRL